MKANQNIRGEFARDESAVSPVVATLMLILVAAGAAVGVNVWLKGFQDKSTDGVALASDAHTLRIGGSSTVWELTNQALLGCPASTDASLTCAPFEAFSQQLGTPIKIELELGGSGAGQLAVCLGHVDIGASSSPLKSTYLADCPDLDGDGKKDFGTEIQQFKVAADGVVFATHKDNTKVGSADFPKVALLQAQARTLWCNAADVQAGGECTGAAVANGFTLTPNWGQVCIASATNLGTVADGDYLDGTVLVPDTSTPGNAPGAADDIAEACTGNTDLKDGPTPGTPLAPILTAAQASEAVQVFDREDPGGTSEVFASDMLGCGGKQLELCTTPSPIKVGDSFDGDGNQGVFDRVISSSNDKTKALFFSGFGYASSGPNAANIVIGDFSKTVTPFPATAKPSTENIRSNAYQGSRPILYLTAGEPSAYEQIWLDYVLNPHTNLALAKASGFVSIY